MLLESAQRLGAVVKSLDMSATIVVREHSEATHKWKSFARIGFKLQLTVNEAIGWSAGLRAIGYPSRAHSEAVLESLDTTWSDD